MFMSLYPKAFLDCNAFTISMLYAHMVDKIFCEIIDQFVLLMAEFVLDILRRAGYWSLRDRQAGNILRIALQIGMHLWLCYNITCQTIVSSSC